MRLKTLVTFGFLSAATAMIMAQAVSSSNWPRENPPRPLPARPVTFPPYEIRKLANGLQVVLVSQNEQPSVSVRMRSHSVIDGR